MSARHHQQTVYNTAWTSIEKSRPQLTSLLVMRSSSSSWIWEARSPELDPLLVPAPASDTPEKRVISMISSAESSASPAELESQSVTDSAPKPGLVGRESKQYTGMFSVSENGEKQSKTAEPVKHIFQDNRRKPYALKLY